VQDLKTQMDLFVCWRCKSPRNIDACDRSASFHGPNNSWAPSHDPLLQLKVGTRHKSRVYSKPRPREVKIALQLKPEIQPGHSRWFIQLQVTIASECETSSKGRCSSLDCWPQHVSARTCLQLSTIQNYWQPKSMVSDRKWPGICVSIAIPF
jgi:hypothetical protein